MKLALERDGAERHAFAVEPTNFKDVLNSLPTNRAGIRLKHNGGLVELVSKDSILYDLAAGVLGDQAKSVRIILFDKSETNNWSLGWHQDRTIAVRDRVDVAGFDNWTMKRGVQHVEPPFDLLENMITLRVHLDEVHPGNAPLTIALGSHKLGRIEADAYEAVAMRCGAVDCLADAGDVWVYSTPILHASKTAQRPGRRRVLQVDYSASVLPGGLHWAEY